MATDLESDFVKEESVDCDDFVADLFGPEVPIVFLVGSCMTTDFLTAGSAPLDFTEPPSLVPVPGALEAFMRCEEEESVPDLLLGSVGAALLAFPRETTLTSVGLAVVV